MKKETDFNKIVRLADSRLSGLSLVYTKVTDVEDFDNYIKSIPHDDILNPIKKAFSEYWCRNNRHEDVLEKELKEIYDAKGYVNIEEVNSCNLNVS